MKTEIKSKTDKWIWLALAVFGLFAALLAVPTYSHVNERGYLTKARDNCKQIILTLKIYSGDQSDTYPDDDLPNARTSNDVFRLLFKAGFADSEAIFGCPSSGDGNPDGNIGKKPDFSEALKPGENHWAMTKGLTGSSAGKIPLVFESPADASWPPKWNPDAAGTTKRGRTWNGSKVIIGFNDGTVEIWPLESTKGEHVGLRPRADGTPIFPDPPPGQKYEILDVAR